MASSVTLESYAGNSLLRNATLKRLCVCVEVGGDNPQIGARVASISVIIPIYLIRQHSPTLRPR